MNEYDFTFFEYFNALKRSMKINPLYLGAVAVGSGSPPGGYIGYLPQGRVSYDQLEASLSGYIHGDAVNASGIIINASLLDNMNHLRYRLDEVEASGGGILFLEIQEDDIQVSEDITIVNFEGDVDVVDEGGGKATVTVTTSGITGYEVKVSSNDTTAGFLEDKIVGVSGEITVTTLNDGSDEDLQIGVGPDVFITGSNTLDDIPDGTTYARVEVDELVDGIYKTAGYTTKGIANFFVGDFVTTTGYVTIRDSGINHNALQNYLPAEHFTKSSILFLDLGDTPATTYSGYGGNYVVVNDTVDGVEFSVGGSVLHNNAVLVASGISILDFSSEFIVTDVGGGKVTIALT